MPDNSKLASLLAKIREAAPPEKDSLRIGKDEEAALEDRLVTDRKKEEIRSLSQDIDERKRYARNTFYLICAWLTGVFFLLVCQGFFGESATAFEVKGWIITIQFNLPQPVLLAVIGGTTASVIGIFILVVQYLFPKR